MLVELLSQNTQHELVMPLPLVEDALMFARAYVGSDGVERAQLRVLVQIVLLGFVGRPALRLVPKPKLARELDELRGIRRNLHAQPM